MKEQIRRYPLVEKLSRIGTTALLAFTLNVARDAHAQDPDDRPEPHTVAALLPPEMPTNRPETEVPLAVALTDARLRSEPSTSSELVGRLREGEGAPVIREVKDGQFLNLRGVQSDVWYEVALEDQSTAYIWSGLVEIMEPVPIEPPPIETDEWDFLDANRRPETLTTTANSELDQALSLVESVQTEYDLPYTLETVQEGEQIYVRSPYDPEASPMFELIEGELRLLHPDRLAVEASYLAGTIEALSAEFDLTWNVAYRGYQRPDGAIWYPGHGTDIPTGESTYFQSDLEQGWVRIGEGNLTSSDFVAGEQGLQIIFGVGVDHPKLEAVGFEPRVLASQAAQDTIAAFILADYPDQAGQTLLIELLSEDLSQERFLTRADNHEGMGVSAYAVNAFALGLNTSDSTTFIRLSLYEGFDNYEWVITPQIWLAVKCALEKAATGSIDINQQRGVYRELGSQVFEALEITDPNQYFDYLTPTLKK